MVKAYKNGTSVTVPYEAYMRLYKPHGWVCDNPPLVNSREEKTPQDEISGMSMSQLKNYARRYGIDISDAKSKAEAEEMIKAASKL